MLLLVLPPLGWRMPLRVHMPLQGAKLLVLAAFGVHPHCRSKVSCCLPGYPAARQPDRAPAPPVGCQLRSACSAACFTKACACTSHH
jgi:hypothetical protein